MMWIMIAATEDDMDEHVAPFVLSGIKEGHLKEKLEVTDLINQLDIADGLKELLLSSSFFRCKMHQYQISPKPLVLMSM